MRLTVIGSGYVGLVAGAGFSDFGNDVICVDLDEKRIARLRAGEIPIYEPGLEELVKRNSAQGRLTFTTDTAKAVAGADVVFIAVGTPPSEDGSADLSHVLGAARAIARGLTGYSVIVTKSTVPVGTADRIQKAMTEETRHPFAVASNPEFLKEGDAVNDFMKPARVIIGCEDPKAVTILRNLYAPFMQTNDRIQVMDPRSAELTKYAANAMLATRISFMNELALLCERVGADIEKVRRGVGSDPRIGPKFLFAGPGYGGSCFPKDIRALLQTGREAGIDLFVTDAAQRANARQKKVLAEYLRKQLGSLTGKKIAIWGLAFKPETDDVRESPALAVIDELLQNGAKVAAFDPAAVETARAVLGDRVEFGKNMYDVVGSADALVIVTEWHAFRRPDFAKLKQAMRNPLLIDGRNVWNSDQVRELGFKYYGIGRPQT